MASLILTKSRFQNFPGLDYNLFIIIIPTTMQVKKTIIALSATSLVSAQRPSDTPVCDYYTTAVLKENTAENQLTLLTVLVNTVVIGNCQ